MSYVGDFPLNGLVYFKWPTRAGDGASITRSTDGTLKIFRNDLATPRSSLSGVTQVEDFAGITGVHHTSIDLADNTDPSFWVAGEFSCVMDLMTIDGKVVSDEVASFSIERPGGALAVAKANAAALADLAGRLPLALTASGYMKADVVAVNGSEDEAGRLQESLEGIGRVTIAAGATLTTLPTTGLDPGPTVLNQFTDAVLVFKRSTTTAALRGQRCRIITVALDGTLTVSALKAIPTAGDEGVIV